MEAGVHCDAGDDARWGWHVDCASVVDAAGSSGFYDVRGMMRCWSDLRIWGLGKTAIVTWLLKAGVAIGGAGCYLSTEMGYVGSLW